MAVKMRYREQKYYPGIYLEVNIYPVWENVYKSGRRTKRKPSTQTQIVLNQHNSERKLARKIDANFSHNDVKFELTYTDSNHPESIEAAQKDFRNFLSRVKRARKRAELQPVKYIYSLEQGSKNGRLHFHVIMSGGLTIQQLAKIWGKGYVDKVLPLMFSKDGCAGIAKYFCKQQLTQGGKRWVASQNCIDPPERTNDHKFSKRRVRDIAVDCDNARMWEQIYPGYLYAGCREFYNDDTGLHYLYLRMYRADATLDI